MDELQAERTDGHPSAWTIMRQRRTGGSGGGVWLGDNDVASCKALTYTSYYVLSVPLPVVLSS